MLRGSSLELMKQRDSKPPASCSGWGISCPAFLTVYLRGLLFFAVRVSPSHGFVPQCRARTLEAFWGKPPKHSIFSSSLLGGHGLPHK